MYASKIEMERVVEILHRVVDEIIFIRTGEYPDKSEKKADPDQLAKVLQFPGKAKKRGKK